MQPRLDNRNELALSELLDRILNKGVVIWGDATISVAGVDLVYVGVKLLLASIDTVDLLHGNARRPNAAETGVAE